MIPTRTDAEAPEPKTLPRPAALSEVKGWFDNADQVLFDWVLSRQQRLGIKGDLLEMGAYMGKSAAFLGSYLRPGETFTVCDLFDSPAVDAHNSVEMQRSYSTLTRRAFEANYRAFHDELPTIVQGPTSTLKGRLEPGTFRFIHIDASHLYEHVHGDIAIAREALSPDGVVALDDYRAEHTPGVAAATWEAVLLKGLRPICLSGRKFYGTWGDPEPVQNDLIEWLGKQRGSWHEVQTIAGHPVVRVSAKNLPPAPQPVSRYARSAASAPAAGRAGTGRGPARRQARLRKLAKELLPPIIARPLAARLRRRR